MTLSKQVHNGNPTVAPTMNLIVVLKCGTIPNRTTKLAQILIQQILKVLLQKSLNVSC